MAYSPGAIQACFDTVNAAMPQAELGGIYANKPGYHNARNQLPSSDYSVQKPYDKEGDSSAASAIDITFRNPPDMKRLTQRLVDETTAHGDTGKLRALREFIGTVDGVNVEGMDVPGRYWFESTDMSHLWHIHLSGKRKLANDAAAWQDVAEVLLGGASDDDPPWEQLMSWYGSKGEYEEKMFSLMTSAVAQFLKYGPDGKQYGFDTLIAKRLDPVNKKCDHITETTDETLSLIPKG